MTAKLVVLISGNGSNLQAILDACASQELLAEVVAVFSNTQDAYGLRRAEAAGVPGIYFAKLAGESRQAYDARLASEVERRNAQYVVLAGWMRLLSSAFLGKFPRRVINLHPALPGMFAGTHAIERAYQAHQQGEIERTGVMVHFVPDEGIDNGPVLDMEEILFKPDENLENFEGRVHEVEHQLLIRALKKVIIEDCSK